MKKANTIKLLLSVLIGACTVGAITGSVAWFEPKASITESNNPIDGLTEGAYFAYGDGTTEAKAYGITKPRHLYNLAWLTYLGILNDKQYYFEVADDIDMEGWVLPPIGTTEYPFVGHFDGKNHIISNATTSNLYSDFGQKHPGTVTSSNFKTNVVKIVGFFGVVGNYNGAYGGASYSSAVNTVSDLGLTNVTVKTYSADTLVGMVAGYSDADITDVAVDTGNVNVAAGAGTSVISPATKVSEYGIIGYTTKTKNIRKVNETIYAVNVSQNNEFNANADGDSTGWGGSVNMLDMYNRLNNVYRLSSEKSFAYRSVETYNAEGELMGSPSDTTYDAYYRYTSNPVIGNFSFINASGDYKYLQGGKRVKRQYYSYYEHSGRPITDGTNYLTFNGSTLGNTTDESKATAWNFTLYSGSVYYISTRYEQTDYYLYYNDGTLSITTGTGGTRRWQINDSGTKRDITYSSNSNVHLTYSSGWTLINNSGSPYYLLYDSQGHFIKPRNQSNGAQADVSATSNDSHWLANLTNKYFYYTYNNNERKLGYYDQSYQVQAWTDTTANGYYWLDTGTTTGTGHLVSKSGYYVYYAGNNDTPWLATTNAGSAATITVEYVDPTSFSPVLLKSVDFTTPRQGPDSYLDSGRTTSQMEYAASDTTYFPLNVVADGGTNTSSVTNGNYNPKDSNTGYVISGSNIQDDTTITNGGPSLIRVSRYDISNINGSYVSSDGELKKSKIYTHNASNTRVLLSQDSFDYQKYDDSSSTLYTNVLAGNSSVYGLHFMSSQISMDHIVNASQVSIQGISHSTYQLPVNSIDFNLKQKGYINFFSGTYFSSTVTSFFSLHHIFRSGTTITDIKEIAEIYGNESKKNYSYAYKYTDGSFSTPYRFDGEGNKYMLTNPESSTPYTPATISSSAFQTYIDSFGYASLFDTVRITNVRNGSVVQSLVQNALYYFEIPMNDGEYCLGSVDGGTGGYLIYLDIGANASKTQRTIASEYISSTEQTFAFPAGVAFLPYNDSGIDDSDSVAMTIPMGFAGKTLAVSRSENTITITENGVSTLTGDLMYLGDSITIESNIKAKLKPKSTSTKEIKRLQYYDYNVNLDEMVKTVITDTIEGGSTTRVVQQFDKNGNAVAESNWKIYRTDNGNKYENSYVKNTSTTLASLGWNNPGNAALLTFYYLLEEGENATEALTLTMVVDGNNTNGQYYKFEDYAFLITVTGGTITVKVLAKGTGTITINGTPVTAADQTITVSAS